MKLNDVFDYYKSYYRFSKDTGFSTNILYYWRKIGYIPLGSQVKLERLSNGALKARFEDGKQY